MEETFFWSGKPENAAFEKEVFALCKTEGLVLDVGCGKQKVHPDLLGVDAYEDYPTVNVQAYMWDMPFADNTVSGIICFSALEHVSKYKVPPTLEEFERVLKPEGKFIILVPDLEYVCKTFLNEPNIQYNMDLIFGTQLNEGQQHRTGFTEDIFAFYFSECCKKSYIINFYRVNAYGQINLAFVCQKGKE